MVGGGLLYLWNTEASHRLMQGPLGPVYKLFVRLCCLPSANPSVEMVPGFLVHVPGPPGPCIQAFSPVCCLRSANPSAEMVPRFLVHVSTNLEHVRALRALCTSFFPRVLSAFGESLSRNGTQIFGSCTHHFETCQGSPVLRAQ